jgi:hypothetical protein
LHHRDETCGDAFKLCFWPPSLASNASRPLSMNGRSAGINR